MSETTPAPEGWTFPTSTARRWHYFRGGRSLCRAYGLLPGQEGRLKPDLGPDPSDCTACTRKLRGQK